VTIPGTVRRKYGQELDLEVSYDLNDHTTVGLMFANFVGYNVYPDVNKFAVWMSYTIL
jgi:hypothetical protein